MSTSTTTIFFVVQFSAQYHAMWAALKAKVGATSGWCYEGSDTERGHFFQSRSGQSVILPL